MKRLMCLLTALLLLLSLAACGPVQEGPTTTPTTEPTSAPTTEPTTEPTTQPTAEPTTEPATEPTEPRYTDTSWLPTAQALEYTYEEFFSQTRIFTHSANLYVNRWKLNEDGSVGTLLSDYTPDRGYALVLDDEGFLIVTFADDEGLPAWVTGNRTGQGLNWNPHNMPLKILWEVPDSEALTGIDCYITDGRYAYCIRNQSEIFRLDLLTGDTETLFTAESIPVDNRDCLSLHDQNILVFLSQSGDQIAINRLYLPTMTLDVLYDGINADAFACNFSLSYGDTDALLWTTMDPEFLPRLMDILGDPDSDYRKYVIDPDRIWGSDDLTVITAHHNFISLVQMIETLEDTPSLLSCYLDIPSGAYEEVPYYWSPDMNETRGYQDVSHWAQLFIRCSNPEAENPVTNTELAEAFDKSPYSFIRTLSEDGPWNERREDIVRQLVSAKVADADTFIEVLEEELRYYRTATARAQPVCQLTNDILNECLRQTGAAPAEG